MRKSKFAEEQLVAVVKEAKAGDDVRATRQVRAWRRSEPWVSDVQRPEAAVLLASVPALIYGSNHLIERATRRSHGSSIETLPGTQASRHESDSSSAGS